MLRKYFCWRLFLCSAQISCDSSHNPIPFSSWHSRNRVSLDGIRWTTLSNLLSLCRQVSAVQGILLAAAWRSCNHTRNHPDKKPLAFHNFSPPFLIYDRKLKVLSFSVVKRTSALKYNRYIKKSKFFCE